jgi:hypothetical protein
MKHSRASHTALHTHTTNSQGKSVERHESRHARFNKLTMSVIGLAGLACIVTVYVLAHRSFSNSSIESEVLPSIQEKALEVEVLDGAGNMKAAQYVTNVLRVKGYDVVEMKRNLEGSVERTYIMDRSGNLEAARTLAEKLGISQDKVFQKIDRHLYLDITVVVGTDFSRLKVFQVSSERSKH